MNRRNHRWEIINGTERNAPGRQLRRCVRCGCVRTWRGYYTYRDGGLTVQSIYRPKCVAQAQPGPQTARSGDR